MMNKTRLLSTAVIGLLVINLGVLYLLFFSRPMHPPGRPPGPERPKEIIISTLHLDKEQIAQYEKLIQQHISTVAAFEEEINKTKNSLYLILSDTSLTGKDSLVNRLGELQKKIETVHYNHFADIRKLCKREQLVFFSSLTNELAHFFAPNKNTPHPPKD